MKTQMPPLAAHLDRVEAALSEPAITTLSAAGAPIVVARGDELRVVWANGPARQLFNADSLAEISTRVFDGAQLGRVTRSLKPGGAPRLERVRLTCGRSVEMVTFLCLHTADEPSLVTFAAMGMPAGRFDANLPPLVAQEPIAEAQPAVTAQHANEGAASDAEPHVSRLRREIIAQFSPTRENAPSPAITQTTTQPTAAVARLRSEVIVNAAQSPEESREPTPRDEPPTPSAAAIAPRSVSDVANELVRRFGNAPVVRFLWKSDPNRRVTEITGELCDVVGCETSEVLGKDFMDFADQCGAEPRDILVSAFARRETWSGVEVLWPIAGAEAAVPVTLGALPCHDAARTFEGFRGFGVVHIQRIEPHRLIARAVETSQEAPPVQTPSPAVAEPEDATPRAAISQAETTARFAEPAAPRDADATPGTEDENELDFFEAMARMTAPPTVAREPQEQEAFAQDEAESEDELETREILEALNAATQPESLEPAPSAKTPAPPGLVDEEADALDQEAPPTADAPDLGANVVPLRAGYRVAPPPPAANDQPAGPKPAEDKAPAHAESPRPPLREPSQIVELTQRERDAFREIARALGAKAEAEADIARTTPAKEITSKQNVDAEGSRRRDIVDVPNDAAPSLEEATRRDAEALARHAPAILERLPTGVLVSRMEVPLYINKALLDVLGFAGADDFHKAGGLERMFRGREPRALTDAAGGGAIPIVTRAGDVISVIARIQSLDWDGAPASMMTFQPTHEADLAPQVRTLEAEVRHRDSDLRELHAILDTATDGVVVLDADGRVLALNKSAEALFGYDQNEVAGERFTTLLARESHASAEDYLEGLKSNGVASLVNQGREVVGRARQDGSFPVFMTLGRISIAGPQKFCAVLRDITAWKKAEKELKEARRDAERASALKSEFLAKVSHEVRTPLNAIIGFAEVIMDERFGPVGNERYKDYLKDIHASGTHVVSLVNDLLDLSKIEAGKLDLDFGAVDANKVIGECVSLMQPQATQGRIIIRQSLAPRLPNIVADERSLRQIVLNLLSNAVKFNEAGGQVIVSTALTDAGHAVIRVKDTGIGMSDAEVQLALEPFRQVQTSRSRGGTGLGLPLTKSLVEANRASFTIKSRKKEGTLVEVAFPPTRVLAE